MSSVGQGANQCAGSPQLQSGSSQGSPSQHSPMGSQKGSDSPQFMSRPRIQELVRQVDPTVQVDSEVEDALLHLADDFLETATNAACILAKHRYSANVELKDVQLHLQRQWNMWVPGFGEEEDPPKQLPVETESHRKRMALIRKLKKSK